MNPVLWRPDPAHTADTRLTHFIQFVNSRHGLSLQGFEALHAWSVAEAPAFWCAVWDFCGVIAESRGETIVAHQKKGIRWHTRRNYLNTMSQTIHSCAAVQTEWIFHGKQ